MIAFVNGQFVPEEQAVVSVFDRSFLYGDGLFETIRVHNKRPFRFHQHVERMGRGAEFLKIKTPFPPDKLREAADKLIRENHMPEAVLRIHLSRGVGSRGYSCKGADTPFLVMSILPAPETDATGPTQWKIVTSTVRTMTNDKLVLHKSANKLNCILAYAEAEARGADDALFLNTAYNVAETSTASLFWIYRDAVCTPPVADGILTGVTRALVMELCQTIGLTTRKLTIKASSLKSSEGVFLAQSVHGIVEVIECDGERLAQSPLVQQVREAYIHAVQRECRSGDHAAKAALAAAPPTPPAPPAA